MASVQKYILTQRLENVVKKTEYDLHVWKIIFLELGEARKIEEIPADKFNILICQFLMEIKKKDGGSYEPAKPQSTIISKKPATIFKRQEFQIETFSRTENSLSPGNFFFLKKTAGFWRSERKSPSCCKRTIQGRRRFVVSHRWTRRWKLWSPPTHSLVVIGTALWILCPGRKQEAKMGRHCSSTDNGQGISDLEIRKRIQDPPRQ